MPRILFISSAFPPRPESHTIRNVFLLQGLARAEIDVTVVTPRCSVGDRSLHAQLPPLEVIETGPAPYHRLETALRQMNLSFALRAMGIFGSVVMTPDTYVGWDRLVLREAARDLDAKSFDGIVSSSGAYSAHIAAGTLARRWRIPHVVEMGDPWTLNPIWPSSMRLKQVYNGLYERGILRRCRAVVVTTQETKLAYEQWLAPRAPRIEVVPMGYSEQDFGSSIACRSGGGGITIAYVGVAYRRSRNLIPLLDAIAGLEKGARAQMKIVGPHSAQFETVVEKRGYNFVETLGRVDYTTSVAHIRAADLLVVVGNKGTLQIPGKIYMYLASGRRILLLTQVGAERDPTWRTLRQYEGTYVAPLQAREIGAVLQRAIADLHASTRGGGERGIERSLGDYTWRTLGDRYAGIVREAIGAE